LKKVYTMMHGQKNIKFYVVRFDEQYQNMSREI